MAGSSRHGTAVGPTRIAGHTARKRFGQHFLTDAGVIAEIVGLIDPRAGETLVEIGPGLGALTSPVLDRTRQLTVVELDRDLAARWRTREPERVRVIESDALALDFAGLGSGFRIYGNLPYNISSPLLFHLMQAASAVQDQHFMLQQEVVARMVAPPACRDYGRLSVMLQWRYAMWDVLSVGPQAFSPPPRVDSAVVRMRPRAPAELSGLDPSVLQALTAAAFSQRRKLLRHALEPWLASRGYAGDFDVNRRAEEVSVSEYVRLAVALNPG